MTPPESKENSEPRTPSSLPARERGHSQPVQQHQQVQQQLISSEKPCRLQNRSTPTLLLSPAKPLRPSKQWASHEFQEYLSLPGRSPATPKSQPLLSPICSRSHRPAPNPKSRDPNGVSGPQ